MVLLFTGLFWICILSLLWANRYGYRRLGLLLYVLGVLLLGVRHSGVAPVLCGEEEYTPWQKERFRRAYGPNFTAVPGCYKHSVWLDVAVHYMQLKDVLPAVLRGTVDPDEFKGTKLSNYQGFVSACTLDQYLEGENPLCEQLLVDVDHRGRLLVEGKLNYYLDEILQRCEPISVGKPDVLLWFILVCVHVVCWLAVLYLCCFAYRHVGFERHVNQYNVTLTVKTNEYKERVELIRIVLDSSLLVTTWYCDYWLFIMACVVGKACLVLLGASGLCDWRKALHDEVIGTNRFLKQRATIDKQQPGLVAMPKGYWFTEKHKYSLELKRLTSESGVSSVYYTDFSRIAEQYYKNATVDGAQYVDRKVDGRTFACRAGVFTSFDAFEAGLKNYNSAVRVLKLAVVGRQREQVDGLVDYLLGKLRACNAVDAQFCNAYFMLMAVHEYVRVNSLECKMGITGLTVRNCPVASQLVKSKVLREQKPYFDLFTGRCFVNSIYEDKVNKVKYSVIRVDESHSVVQVYNQDCVNMFGRHKRNCGTVRVKAEYADEVAKYLSKVDPSFEYEAVESSEIPHAKSHYLSKVLHMREINKLIDLNAFGENLVWDVGTTFCDLVLGAGVVYNLAVVEERDQLRCHNYAKRLDSYLNGNSECGVSIYCGDVVTMDMNAVGISTVLMQNCCYNVDLLDMAYSYMKNSYDKLVTVTQLPRAVVDGQLCDNTTNEMVYFYEYEDCQSKLSEANFQIVGLTEGGVYVHNGARLLDWFVYDSLKFGSCYMLKTIDVPKFGYYIQTWSESMIPRCGPQYLLDNDSNCDLLSVVNTNGVASVVVSTREREVNFNDSTFMTYAVDNSRNAANTHMFRSIMGEKGSRCLLMDLKDVDLALYEGTALIYKMVRAGYEQRRIDVGLQIKRGVPLGRSTISTAKFAQLGAITNIEDLKSVLKLLFERDCGLVVRLAGVNYNLAGGTTLIRYCCYDWDECRWRNDLGAINYELEGCVGITPENFMIMTSVVKARAIDVGDSCTVGNLQDAISNGRCLKSVCNLKRNQHVTVKSKNGGANVVEEMNTYVLPSGPWWTKDVDNSCTGELVQERYNAVAVVDLVERVYYDPFDTFELRGGRITRRAVQRVMPRYVGGGAYEVYDDNNVRGAKVLAELPNNTVVVVNVLGEQYITDLFVICGYKMGDFKPADKSGLVLCVNKSGTGGNG